MTPLRSTQSPVECNNIVFVILSHRVVETILSEYLDYGKLLAIGDARAPCEGGTCSSLLFVSSNGIGKLCIRCVGEAETSAR